jgi:hypothetical protein
VRIDNHEVSAETCIKVLGVHVDSKLHWKEHIRITAGRGHKAFEALSRITASTWGPSVQKSKLVFTAVVRPLMLYGAQIWGIQDTGEIAKKNTLHPLKVVQNKCLRRVMGAYKRTPTALLEREAQVMPVDLYIDLLALQRASATKGHSVTRKITQVTQTIWNTLQDPEPETTRRGRGRPRTRRDRASPTRDELLRARAEDRETEITAYRHHLAETRERTKKKRKRKPRGDQGQYQKQNYPQGNSLLKEWADLAWRNRWNDLKGKNVATAWKTPWDKRPIKLYEDLPKHEATALFLLRTEVLGLNNWLASINVPDFTPACPCGWIRQTVRHILLFCPLYEQGRAEIVRKAASTDMTTILSKPGSGAAAARWLTRSGALPQFRTAVEIALDTTRGEDPTELREWTL